MSDIVALASTLLLGLWFVGFSSLLAVDIWGAASVPSAVRFTVELGGRPIGGWRLRLRMAVAWLAVVVGEVAAVAAIAQNLGHATGSQILILCAQPALAIVWVVYLIRYRAKVDRG